MLVTVQGRRQTMEVDFILVSPMPAGIDGKVER